MDGMRGELGVEVCGTFSFKTARQNPRQNTKKEEKTSTQKTDRLEHQQEGSGTKDKVGRFGEGSSHARQELKSAAGEGRVMQ